MAKLVVRYLLWGNGNIPDFIENGGYIPDSDGEMIGLTVDNTSRFVPSTVSVVSKADMIARCVANMIHKDTGVSYTTEQATTYVEALLNQFGIPYYE